MMLAGALLLLSALPPVTAVAAWKTRFADAGMSSYLAQEIVVPPFSVAWEYETEDSLRDSALIAGGRVFLITKPYHVFSLDFVTGERRWAHTEQDLPDQAFSLDFESGAVRWKRSLEGNVIHTPILGSGAMFVATEAGWIYSISQYSGEVLWRTSHPLPLTLAAADRELVVIGSGRAVRGIDPADGKLLFEYAELGGPPSFQPAMASDGVYVPDGKTVIVLGRDGRERWRADYKRLLGAPLAVTPHGVLAAYDDGTVHLLDRASGHRKWEVILAGRPSIAAGVGQAAYIGTRSGTIVCLRLEDGAKLWSVKAADSMIDGVALSDGRLVVTAARRVYSLLSSPEPPDYIVARREGGTAVVRWVASHPNQAPISAYIVWRRAPDGSWNKVGLAGTADRSFNAGGITGNAFFAVSALAVDGANSILSREAAIDAHEPLVTGFAVGPRPYLQGRGPLRTGFTLRERARITWDVTDAEGQPVTEERTEFMWAGTRMVEWDGRERNGQPAPVGVYFVRLRAAVDRETEEMAGAFPLMWSYEPSDQGALAGAGDGGWEAGKPASGGAGTGATVGGPGTGAPGSGAGVADGATGKGHGNNGVRDHGQGEGRDGAGQGKGQGDEKGKGTGKK